MNLKSVVFQNLFLFFIIITFFSSCQKIPFSFSKVDINHVLLDSTLNIRALEINGNKVYNATSKGEIYSFDITKPDLINVEQYNSELSGHWL